jgi:hypothetical protein
MGDGRGMVGCEEAAWALNEGIFYCNPADAFVMKYSCEASRSDEYTVAVAVKEIERQLGEQVGRRCWWTSSET